MTYRFKLGPETAWLVAVAVAVAVLQPLVTLDPAKITDWHTWLVALLGGAIRAAAGALLGVLTKPEMPPHG